MYFGQLATLRNCTFKKLWHKAVESSCYVMQKLLLLCVGSRWAQLRRGTKQICQTPELWVITEHHVVEEPGLQIFSRGERCGERIRVPNKRIDQSWAGGKIGKVQN